MVMRSLVTSALGRPRSLFCSGKGSNIGDLTVELNEFFGSMINMDDPNGARAAWMARLGWWSSEALSGPATMP